MKNFSRKKARKVQRKSTHFNLQSCLVGQGCTMDGRIETISHHIRLQVWHVLWVVIETCDEYNNDDVGIGGVFISDLFFFWTKASRNINEP